MNKITKNIIGLVLTGLLHCIVVIPILTGASIKLPSDVKMLGAMLIQVIALPLISFLIPGIIAFNLYTENKTFWKYFYSTGWIIYILVLIIYSFVLGNLKLMN